MTKRTTSRNPDLGKYAPYQDDRFPGKWLVLDQKSKTGRPGFGDTLHSSEAEAIKQAEFNHKLDAQDAKRAAALEEEKRQAAAEEAERQDIDGFMSDAPSLARGKAISVLSKPVTRHGKVTTVKGVLRELAKNGWHVDTDGKDFVSPEGFMIAVSKLGGSTGVKYFYHLTGKKNPSQKKNPLLSDAYSAGRAFASAKFDKKTPRFSSFEDWWKEKGQFAGNVGQTFDKSDAKDMWVDGMNSLKRQNPNVQRTQLGSQLVAKRDVMFGKATVRRGTRWKVLGVSNGLYEVTGVGAGAYKGVLSISAISLANVFFELGYEGPVEIEVKDGKAYADLDAKNADPSLLKMKHGKKNPYLGFQRLRRSLTKKGVADPAALAASIGRKKYGKEEFQKMALAGRRKVRRVNPEFADESSRLVAIRALERELHSLYELNDPSTEPREIEILAEIRRIKTPAKKAVKKSAKKASDKPTHFEILGGYILGPGGALIGTRDEAGNVIDRFGKRVEGVKLGAKRLGPKKNPSLSGIKKAASSAWKKTKSALKSLTPGGRRSAKALKRLTDFDKQPAKSGLRKKVLGSASIRKNPSKGKLKVGTPVIATWAVSLWKGSEPGKGTLSKIGPDWWSGHVVQAVGTAKAPRYLVEGQGYIGWVSAGDIDLVGGGTKKNPPGKPYGEFGSGPFRVIVRTKGKRQVGTIYRFEKESDARKFAKSEGGIFAGSRAKASNPRATVEPWMYKTYLVVAKPPFGGKLNRAYVLKNGSITQESLASFDAPTGPDGYVRMVYRIGKGSNRRHSYPFFVFNLGKVREMERGLPKPLATVTEEDYDQLMKWFDQEDRRQNPSNKTRNPSASAEKLYQKFHGRPSDSSFAVKEKEHVHSHLAQLGTLTEIVVAIKIGGQGKAVLYRLKASETAKSHSDRKAVHLTSNEEGTQLFLTGGDQSLNLKALGFVSSEIKEQMVIGQIKELTYRTQKSFDDFKTIDYFHGLGEENGNKPLLLYKPRDKKLLIFGGDYQVKPEGIVN